MSLLGDKRTAKDYLRQHDPQVPLIPGYAGDDDDVAKLEQAAMEIGYPVMLKASAGGGGRGMRIVQDPSKLQEQLASAKSEAARSFGSGDCILEKYIQNGKHIEIQLVGDGHGNILSLWDRECSIQRRHQKVIEESPSPFLTPEKRKQISEAAIRVGKLIGYENAGTVEFVFDAEDQSFYFLEVNTRLQVEHPITEEVTGVDIVSLQLYVASGGDLTQLPALQNITQIGHAVECRLCAEDPENNFFPEHGLIRFWQPPGTDGHYLTKDVRFETAVQTGTLVSIHFDSMIAKIVVWAPTRVMAIQKSAAILSQLTCIGVKTNQSFLQHCLRHPAFQRPDYTTSFIPDNLTQLVVNPYTEASPEIQRILQLIPSAFLRSGQAYMPQLGGQVRRPFRSVRPDFRNQRFDPVGGQHAVISTGSGGKAGQEQSALICNWKTGGSGKSTSIVAELQPLPAQPPLDEAQSAALRVTTQYNAISNALRSSEHHPESSAHEIEILQCSTVTATGRSASTPWINAALTVRLDGRTYECTLSSNNLLDLGSVFSTGQANEVYYHVSGYNTWSTCRYYDLLSYCDSIRQAAEISSQNRGGNTVTAPMPCKILNVLKNDGEKVKVNDIVLVVESMKMEMNISAPRDGVFRTGVKKNDAIDEGAVLCRIE